MSDWILWFGLAGVLVVFEMLTGTFYLLMLAIGLSAAGVAALLNMGQALQLIAAAVIGVSAIYVLRRSKLGRSKEEDPARDPNVNLDIGQALMIDVWCGNVGETRAARAMYRGAMWDVELAQNALALPGLFVIQEVRGNRLIVTNNKLNHNSQKGGA